MGHTKLIITTLTIATVVAISLSVATLIIADRQSNAIKAAHESEYRICYRQMVNRAVIDNTKDFDTDDKTKFLPLYDCTPNLQGKPPRRLTFKESKLFRSHIASLQPSQLQ